MAWLWAGFIAFVLLLLTLGVKMLTAQWVKAAVGEHFNFHLLVRILLILAGGIIASLLADRCKRHPV